MNCLRAWKERKQETRIRSMNRRIFLRIQYRTEEAARHTTPDIQGRMKLPDARTQDNVQAISYAS